MALLFVIFSFDLLLLHPGRGGRHVRSGHRAEGVGAGSSGQLFNVTIVTYEMPCRNCHDHIMSCHVMTM